MGEIRNVIKVERILSSQLTITKISGGNVHVPEGLGWEQIQIQVPARLTINNKVDNKVSVSELSLVFRTCQDLTADGKHYCYRITLANGKQYLMGDTERPYPVTTVNFALSDSVKDNQQKEVTVTLTKRGKEMVIS